MTTENTVSVSGGYEDTLQTIFVRCACAILASKKMAVTKEAMDYIIALAEAHMQELFAQLHHITEVQRRLEPSVADIGIWLREQGLLISGLQAEMKLSSKFTEDLNHLQLDPNPPTMSETEKCFFIEPSTAIKEVVPSHSRLNGWLPRWMPQLPPDHTFMTTPEYTQRVTDPRELRERIVEEGRQAEEALQRLIGLRYEGDESEEEDEDEDEESKKEGDAWETEDKQEEHTGHKDVQMRDEDVSLVGTNGHGSNSHWNSGSDSASESDVDSGSPRPALPSLKISFGPPKERADVSTTASTPASEDEDMEEIVMPVDVKPEQSQTVQNNNTETNGETKASSLPKISLSIKPLAAEASPGPVPDVSSQQHLPHGSFPQGSLERMPSAEQTEHKEELPSPPQPASVVPSASTSNVEDTPIEVKEIDVDLGEATGQFLEDGRIEGEVAEASLERPIVAEEPLEKPASEASSGQPIKAGESESQLPEGPQNTVTETFNFNNSVTGTERSQDSSLSPNQPANPPLPKITLKPLKIRLSLGSVAPPQPKEEPKMEPKLEQPAVEKHEDKDPLKDLLSSVDPFNIYTPLPKEFDVVEYSRKRLAVEGKKRQPRIITKDEKDEDIPAGSGQEDIDDHATESDSPTFDSVFADALKSIDKSHLMRDLESAAINWNADRFVQ